MTELGKLNWVKRAYGVFVLCAATAIALPAQTTYNAATAFEAGWTAHSNPNGVWSYGFSSSFTSAITLYDTTAQPGINGPNAQYWISSLNNVGESPSAEYNDDRPMMTATFTS